MPAPSAQHKNKTTAKSLKPWKKHATLCLMILALFVTLPTKSSATVTAINSETVQMTNTDLKTLITEIQVNKAKAQATAEALASERELFGAYEMYVEQLIAVQEAERAETEKLIKSLTRRLNAPRLELYTGYDTNDQWEGGIRLSWPLN